EGEGVERVPVAAPNPPSHRPSPPEAEGERKKRKAPPSPPDHREETDADPWASIRLQVQHQPEKQPPGHREETFGDRMRYGQPTPWDKLAVASIKPVPESEQQQAEG